MTRSIQHGMEPDRNNPLAAATDQVGSSVARIQSKDLFRQMREVEIEHAGRIYKLRVTQLNKLILTA
jgi:hemin uptake protein HemP